MASDPKIAELGIFSLYSEWSVDFEDDSTWFVRLYHKDVPRRNAKAGDYVVEVFTSDTDFLPFRPMTPDEVALFQRVLASN